MKRAFRLVQALKIYVRVGEGQIPIAEFGSTSSIF